MFIIVQISKMRTNAIHLEQCHNVKKDELMNEIVKLKQQIKEKKKNVASPQEKVCFFYWIAHF